MLGFTPLLPKWLSWNCPQYTRHILLSIHFLLAFPLHGYMTLIHLILFLMVGSLGSGKSTALSVPRYAVASPAYSQRDLALCLGSPVATRKILPCLLLDWDLYLPHLTFSVAKWPRNRFPNTGKPLCEAMRLSSIVCSFCGRANGPFFPTQRCICANFPHLCMASAFGRMASLGAVAHHSFWKDIGCSSYLFT